MMLPLDSARARWFEAQIRPHEPVLRAWLRRRFPATLDVDDIVQESYLRLLRRAPDIELKSPKAFLFTIARNLALDCLRRRRNSVEVALAADASAQAMDEAISADEAERGDEIVLLQAAIEALPGRCREIFRLRKVEGLSQAQIAARLGISEHTVSAQLTIGFHKCASFVIERAVWRKEGD